MVIPCYTPLPTQECWLLEHLEGAKGLFWTHWLRPTAGFLLELNPLDAEDDVPWMSRARMEAFCMPNTGITGTVSSMFFSFFFWLPICSILVQSFRGTHHWTIDVPDFASVHAQPTIANDFWGCTECLVAEMTTPQEMEDPDVEIKPQVK